MEQGKRRFFIRRFLFNNCAEAIFHRGRVAVVTLENLKKELLLKEFFVDGLKKVK